MNKIIFLLCFLPFISTAQHSCCSLSATQKFEAFASSETFVAAHEAPLPLDYQPENGGMVTFPLPEGSSASAFEIKSAKPTSNWLLVFHEWWGLNDYMKREGERLQTELGNVNVLVLDLYDGKVAETPGVARELMGGLKDEHARAIVQAALNYVGSKAKVFTLGWCMGGGWSMQAALMSGKQLSACVMYYGMPESDITKLKKLNGDVLGIFGKRDGWINEQVVSKFQTDMKAAGKKLIIKTYDADHAFANPSNPKYDKDAAGQANKEMLSFLKSRLK